MFAGRDRYGLGANRATVAALLRAVGATVGSMLSRGRGTQLPGLGTVGVWRQPGESSTSLASLHSVVRTTGLTRCACLAEHAGAVPYFVLDSRFAAAHGVGTPSEFVPLKGQRLAPADPLNFSAVCSRLDPQSGASFGRSDTQTLWDCVVSCFGELALRREGVTLDLPPVGALRCTPGPGTRQASSPRRKHRLTFAFSPGFSSHSGLAVPGPRHASHESFTAETAHLGGSRPSSRGSTRPTSARRRRAWGDGDRRPSERVARNTQQVGFTHRDGGPSRDAASGGVAWGDDPLGRGATPSESSFGVSGRGSSRDSTRTADDDFAEFARLEQAEHRGLQTACRLLDVFQACDINDAGKIAAGEVGTRLSDVLGLDLTVSEAGTVGRWLQTTGTGRGGDWLGRLGFVRGFLAAAKPRQEQLHISPPAVRRVAERALDSTHLLDNSAKASLLSRNADSGVPAAQLQAVLNEVLPRWPDRALLWLLCGQDPHRVVELERARQYSQPEPLIDYNAVLLGIGDDGEALGEGGTFSAVPGSATHHGTQAVSAAEAELLRIVHDAMQKGRLTVADAFHTMDIDHDGRISVADVATFLRNRGDSVAPQAISEFLGGEASVDYPYLRKRLDRVPGDTALADDWEEVVFQTIRDWVRSQRMTLNEAFRKVSGGGAKIDREQFHAAVRQAAGNDLTVWQLDHLFRFVDASGTGKIDSASWLRRFEDGSRPAGWSERSFQQLADILYAKQMPLAAFVASLDDNKDGKISVSELQRGILKLQSGLDQDERLSTAEAKELAQLTDTNHTGLVDVTTLEARVNKGTASLDNDSNLLKVVQKALSKSGQTRDAIEIVFKRFSNGKSTALTYEEFLKGVNSMMPTPLSKQQQDRLIKLTDRDGDRSIDVEEFLAILTPSSVDEKKQLRRYIQLHIQEQSVGWQELFDSFDADASGFLSVAELQKGFLSLPFFKQRLKLTDQQIKDKAAECFKEADPDQDGYLSITEFERYFSGKTSQPPMSVADRRHAQRSDQLTGAAGQVTIGRVNSRSNQLAQKGEAFASRRLRPGSATAPFATEQNEVWTAELSHNSTTKATAPWEATPKTKARGRLRYGTESIRPAEGAAPVLDASQWSAWPDVNSREFQWPKPVHTRGPKLNPLKSLEPDQRFRDWLFEKNVTPMEVFRAFDVDGDGFVSRDEWLYGMSGRSQAAVAVLGDVRELKLTLPDAERIYNMMDGSERDWVDQAAFWAVCQERKPAPGWEVGIVKQVKAWLQAQKVDADKLWKMWTANTPEAKELKPKQFAAGLRQIGITLSAQLVAGLLRWMTKGTGQVLTRQTFVAKMAVAATVGWQAEATAKIGALLTKGFPNNQMAWEEFRKRDDDKRSSAPHLDSWQRFRELCEQDPAGKQLRLSTNQWKELFHSLHAQSGRNTLDLGEFNKAFERSAWAKQTLAVAADAFSTAPGRSPAEIFKQVDANGDGTIDRLEFGRAMQLLNPNIAADGVARLWGHVDSGEQGKIGLAQFCSRLGESSVGMSREVDNANALRGLIMSSGDVDKVFKSIDKSGDGFIDALEFRQAVTRLGAGLSARECQAVFSLLDKNGDGGLSLDELREWITGKRSQWEASSWASCSSGSGRSAGEIFHQVVAGGPGADQSTFCVIARILCPTISPSELQQAWGLINPGGQSSFLSLTQLSTKLTQVAVGQQFDEKIDEHVRTLVGSAANVPKVFQVGGSSVITLLQFREALDRCQVGLPPRVCANLFTRLDTTGDGSVSLAELRDWVSGDVMPTRPPMLAVVRKLMAQQLGSASATFDWMFAEAVATPREQLAKRTIRGVASTSSRAGGLSTTRNNRRQDTARGSKATEKLSGERKRRPVDPKAKPALSANSFVTALHRMFSSLSDRSVMSTQADALGLFIRAGGKTLAAGSSGEVRTQQPLDRNAFVCYFSHPCSLPARESTSMLPCALDFISSHSATLLHELSQCASSGVVEVVDREMFMAAGVKVTPSPTPLQLKQLWNHIDQLSNGSVLCGEFLFRTAPAVVPRNLRWSEERLQSLRSLIKPRPVPTVSTADFRQTLMAGGIEDHWSSVFHAAAKTISVFDAAAQLVRRYGHCEQQSGSSSPRDKGSAAALVVSREDFCQWCHACGYGSFAITEREWKTVCTNAYKAQRARIRSIWAAVAMERSTTHRTAQSASDAHSLADTAVAEVLRRLGLPLTNGAVELLVRKAAGFATQQQQRASTPNGHQPLLSFAEFQSWWDQVGDMQLALAEAKRQYVDVSAMLSAVSDKTTPQTPTVLARKERLTLGCAELQTSIARLAQAITRQGGDLLPCLFTNLSAVGVAENFGSLLGAPVELQCTRAEFVAAASRVAGGGIEIGVGGMPRRSRGDDREAELTELWSFLDYHAVGFVDLSTFEHRLGGDAGTHLRQRADAIKMPPQLAREWERPAIDGVRRQLHTKIKQRLWRDLLAVADTLSNGRNQAGQVEYAGFIDRCKLRYSLARSHPAVE